MPFWFQLPVLPGPAASRPSYALWLTLLPLGVHSCYDRIVLPSTLPIRTKLDFTCPQIVPLSSALTNTLYFVGVDPKDYEGGDRYRHRHSLVTSRAANTPLGRQAVGH